MIIYKVKLTDNPKKKKKCIKYNTNLISSADVQQLFSLAMFFHFPFKSSMSDDTF